MPGSADRARDVARGRRVQAVVWISRSEDGFALWMYDTRRDRIVARKLGTAPPFDEATAASVALTIKTLLRQSDVPPSSERLEEPASEAWLRLRLLAGLRPNGTSQTVVEPRMGVEPSIWWGVGASFQLGLGLAATFGPGIGVESAFFDGRWTETTALLTVHGRWKLTASWDVTLLPSAGLGLTTMDGVVRSPPRGAHEARINPVAAVHGEVGYRLARFLRAGVRLGVQRPLVRQAYLVRGDRFLRQSPVGLDAMFVLEAGIF